MLKQDITGKTFGKYKVLTRAHAYNKKVYYNVICLNCNEGKTVSADRIKENKTGCPDCSPPKAGPESQGWQGGKFISATFLSNFRRGAKRRGISFNLTVAELDEIWESQNGVCTYSGRKLVLGDNASLDRIDSSIGYQKNNVQFVDKDINILKWDWKEDYFMEMVKEVYWNMLEKK